MKYFSVLWLQFHKLPDWRHQGYCWDLQTDRVVGTYYKILGGALPELMSSGTQINDFWHSVRERSAQVCDEILSPDILNVYIGDFV